MLHLHYYPWIHKFATSILLWHVMLASTCAFVLANQYLGMVSKMPAASLEIALQQRMELENYILVPRLLDGHWGQAPVSDAPSKSVTSYGTAGLLPFSLGWAAGGAMGVIAADFLVLIANYFLWFVVFQKISRHPYFSAAFSGFICSGGLVPFLPPTRAWTKEVYGALQPYSLPLIVILAGVAVAWIIHAFKNKSGEQSWPWLFVPGCLMMLLVIHHYQSEEFWYTRHLPRPYATSLFTTLWFYAMLRMWEGAGCKWPLIAWAAAALTMQSDVYSFIPLGLLFSVLVVKDLREGWRGQALGAGIFLALGLPFFLQRTLENPEVPMRLGIDALSLSWREYLPYAGFLVPLAFGLLLSAIMWLRGNRWLAPAWIVLLGWCLAPVIIKLTLGKAPQMWHYAFLIPAAFTWFVSLGLTALAGVAQSRPDGRRSYAGNILACFGIMGVLACAVSSRADESRPPGIKPGADSLQEVVSVIKSNRHGTGNRLATLDPRLNAYWSAWEGSVVQPFCVLSPLNEEEQLQRAGWFLRECQLDPLQTARFVNDPASRIVYFYLGCYQYQSKEPYPNTKAREYPSFGWVLPPAQVEKLRSYQQHGPDYQADWLVISPKDEQAGLRPQRWSKVFQNVDYLLFVPLKAL